MTEETKTQGASTESKTEATDESSKVISYRPLNEASDVELSLSMIYHHIAVVTKNGSRPNKSDCLKFMHLCQSRQLNPWTGDCYMLGYDTKDGPKFELIVAYQALLKRAEHSEHFSGLEGGIIVRSGDGIDERVGAFYLEGEEIVGGWAKAHRDDCQVAFEAKVKLSTYDTGRSRWAKDPAGMIVKVAKSAVLREAFPNIAAGMYIEDEMEHVHINHSTRQDASAPKALESPINPLGGSDTSEND